MTATSLKTAIDWYEKKTIAQIRREHYSPELAICELVISECGHIPVVFPTGLPANYP